MIFNDLLSTTNTNALTFSSLQGRLPDLRGTRQVFEVNHFLSTSDKFSKLWIEVCSHIFLYFVGVELFCWSIDFKSIFLIRYPSHEVPKC